MNFLTEEDMLEFAEFLINEYSIPFHKIQMGITEDLEDFTLGVRVKNPAQSDLKLGSIENTKIRNLNVQFFVHGNRSERESEYIANLLFINLEKLKNGFYCDDIPIIMLVPTMERPYPLGADEKGIFEFVIDFSIKYRCD